jgi:protein-S-isoprenylcysteine O-methyltransferase Ste14
MNAEKRKPVPPTTVVMMILVVVVVPFLPLLISWRWGWWEAWTYWIAAVVGFIASRLLAARRNPDLIAERARYAQHDDTKDWDKILSPIVGLGSGLIPIAAGLEARFGQPAAFSLGVKIVLFALILFGYVFASWALIENRFFSGTVRIQTDRGHTVVSTGPYAIVRHPGYASSLFTFLASPFFLDSLWALIPAVLITAAMVVRTALEDRTLHAELPGYEEYSRRTRFRLIPGIW